MILSYAFDGIENFQYDITPNYEDIEGYLGCDEEEAISIADNEIVDGYPAKDELFEESEFKDYLQDFYRNDAYCEWESTHS